MKLLALSLGTVLTALGATQVSADNYYGSLKYQQGAQSLKGATLTSPRVESRINSPSTSRVFSGSLAVGTVIDDVWRVEAEYTTPQKAQFKTQWRPFDTNVNDLQLKTQRLMVHGYRDLPITEALSLYGTVGVGIAHINAKGYQGTPDRTFTRKTQDNLAYSIGLGANYKVTQAMTVGAGYRVIRMGSVETGHNTFANAINARDEQLKGKLTERDLFLEARYAF